MKIGWLCLLCAALPLQAEQTIYRWVDAQGVVHFADHPQPGQQVESLTLPTPPSPAAPPPFQNGETTASNEPQAPTIRYQLRLVSPTPGATLRNNEGNVQVQAVIEPLPTSPYRLNLLLDDQLLATSRNGLSASLSNVDRGTHRLQAQLQTEDGKILASSTPVTFYLFRSSLLNRPAVQPAP